MMLSMAVSFLIKYHAESAESQEMRVWLEGGRLLTVSNSCSLSESWQEWYRHVEAVRGELAVNESSFLKLQQ